MLYMMMWKDIALLDPKVLKIRRSAFYGTPGKAHNNQEDSLCALQELSYSYSENK